MRDEAGGRQFPGGLAELLAAVQRAPRVGHEGLQTGSFGGRERDAASGQLPDGIREGTLGGEHCVQIATCERGRKRSQRIAHSLERRHRRRVGYLMSESMIFDASDSRSFPS